MTFMKIFMFIGQISKINILFTRQTFLLNPVFSATHILIILSYKILIYFKRSMLYLKTN